MKFEAAMNGIEKEVDNLGRVVIPMDFRKRLGIVSNSKVMVSLEGDIIVISPSEKYCALCGHTIDNNEGFLRLCGAYIAKIRENL